MSGQQLDPNATLLDDIKRLQQLEQSLYAELETTSAQQANLISSVPDADSCRGFECTIENQKCLSGKPGAGNKNWICRNKKWIVDDGTNSQQQLPNYDKQKQIMDQIDQLTQMRMNMFKQIQGQFSGDQSDLTGTQKSIASQLALAKVTETQLKDMKKQVRQLEDMKNDKLRMVEIGSYEAQRYDAYKNVMLYIFLTAIAMVLINKFAQLGILPDFLSTGLMSVVLVTSMILVARKLVDIGSRSPLNFDKYDFSSESEVSQLQSGYETVVEHDKRAVSKMLNKVYGDGSSAFGLNGSVDRVKLTTQSTPAYMSPLVENFAAF